MARSHFGSSFLETVGLSPHPASLFFSFWPPFPTWGRNASALATAALFCAAGAAARSGSESFTRRSCVLGARAVLAGPPANGQPLPWRLATLTRDFEGVRGAFFAGVLVVISAGGDSGRQPSTRHWHLFHRHPHPRGSPPSPLVATRRFGQPKGFETSCGS